jgi:hypothetical protein
MSVLRYNIVKNQKPYRARETHLRDFFKKLRQGLQPVDPREEESTLITARATTDALNPKAKRKYKKNPVKKETGGKSVDTSKVEDKIKNHKFNPGKK